MLKKLSVIRRTLLKTLVPEFIWPEETEINGVKFKVKNTPYSFAIKLLLTRNPDLYELPERKLLLNVLKPGDSVLEMGGSIGILTGVISDKIGKNGTIVSVEASTITSRYSKSWLEAKGNVHVVNALAFPIYNRKNMKVSFDSTRGSLGGRVTFEILEPEEANNNNNHTFFIKDAEDKFGLKPTILVIDIEGSEEIILKEEVDFPTYIKHISIELHPAIYGVDKTLAIVERIKSGGFQISSSLNNVYLFTRTSD